MRGRGRERQRQRETERGGKGGKVKKHFSWVMYYKHK